MLHSTNKQEQAESEKTGANELIVQPALLHDTETSQACLEINENEPVLKTNFFHNTSLQDIYISEDQAESPNLIDSSVHLQAAQLNASYVTNQPEGK